MTGWGGVTSAVAAGCTSRSAAGTSPSSGNPGGSAARHVADVRPPRARGRRRRCRPVWDQARAALRAALKGSALLVCSFQRCGARWRRPHRIARTPYSASAVPRFSAHASGGWRGKRRPGTIGTRPPEGAVTLQLSVRGFHTGAGARADAAGSNTRPRPCEAPRRHSPTPRGRGRVTPKRGSPAGTRQRVVGEQESGETEGGGERRGRVGRLRERG